MSGQVATGTPVFSMSPSNPRSAQMQPGMAPATPPPFNGSSSMSAPGYGAGAEGPGASSSPAHTALDMDDQGNRGGDFVTRTWQPARAPDAVALAEVTSQMTSAANVAEVFKATGLGQQDIQSSASRTTEDDGLIVRQRPRARADNIAVRKARAAREARPGDWFDPNDGGILCQADPVPPGVERARPARWFDPEAPYLQTVPATDSRIDLEIVDAAGSDRTYRFDISVGRLEFSCHPLMSKEDFLAAQLEESFRSYKRREASDLVTLYTAKNAAATARAQALRQEMAAGAALWLAGVSPSDRLIALEEEAEEAQRLAIDEGDRMKASVQHMSELHDAIERERIAYGCRSTSIRFAVRQKGNGDAEPVLLAGAARDEGAHVPKPEQQRRAKATSTRFCVALEVNGQQVPGTSRPVTLRSSGGFSTEVAHAFSLSVQRWPDSVRLALYEKGTIVDTFLAVVPIAVPGSDPGEPLQDAAPRQYQFSAESPHAPAWRGAQGDASRVQYTSGSLFVTCAWTPNAANAIDMGAYARHTGPDVERSVPIAPPPPPSTAAKRAAAAAKVGYADAAGGFGRAVAKPAPVQAVPGGSPSKTSAAALRASLDPLNPEDATLLETLATREALRNAGGGGFRLNLNDETMLGVNAKATKRQQLLKLRAEGGVEALPEGGVPLSEGDIPDHLLEQNAEVQSQSKLLSAQLPGLAEADKRATRIAEFLAKVKLNVAKGRRDQKMGARASKGVMHTDDVVKDSPLPAVTFDFTGVFEFFQPRRKLRPARRRAAPPESHPDHCELVVGIQKAFNLPTRAGMQGGAVGGVGGGRRSMQRGGGYGGGYGDGYGGGNALVASGELNCFVEVSFQGQTLRTRLANGSAPSWQESLQLPFRPPGGDFSPAALQGCEDVVTISLFDEAAEPAERTYGAGAVAGGTSTTRHFLGSIDIPVAALYRGDGGKIEGVLPLDAPPVLLGYSGAGGGAGGGGGGGRASLPGGGGLAQQPRPSMSVYIQFAPALAKPEPTLSDPGVGEDESVLRHAKVWEKECRAVSRHTKQRPYRAVATDGMGRSVHLCRYIASAQLPPGFQGAIADEPTLRQLMRFCHLVPHVTDMSAFNLPPGVDIWTTSQEFLDMCAGDSEEHALLLCGFLVALGVEAYVVLGVSATDSDAAMVFTPGGQGKRPGNPPTYAPMLEDSLIWDPMAGTIFSVYDSACSACLGEIGVVFNSDNVWANVQAHGRPHEMNWNLNDAHGWRPFFSAGSFPHRAMPTVQTAITYESYPPAFYERLGAAVEREAMDAIVKKRARQHTPFNRRASRALKDLLRNLEGQILISPDDQGGGLNLGGGMRVGSLTELHMSQLAGICEGYTVTGCPMNLPFTDAATVRDVIDRLKIADTTRSDVEFAVATHVEPYGCTFVCSVWVYVVRLTKISSYQ